MVSFISRVPPAWATSKANSFCLVRRKIDSLVIDNEIKGHISAENDALLPFSIAGGVQTRKEFPQRKRKVNDVGEIADKLFSSHASNLGALRMNLQSKDASLATNFKIQWRESIFGS